MARPIREQVVVITGASSGIGRLTALKFAEQRAAVVLAARNEHALNEVSRQIQAQGGQSHVVITDTGVWEQVDYLAQEATRRFGRIDTWINDASEAEYATVEQLTVAEIDQIIRVNLIGYIYGSKAAAAAMRKTGGGTIINIASVLAELSVPLQSVYCAAKHGVRGFDDSLRLELKHEKSGIEVVTVYPSSINTPFFEHARSKIGVLPQPIPPVYEPDPVVEAILNAAEFPKRDVVVGGAGMFFNIVNKINPRLIDFYMLQNGRMFKDQKSDRPDDQQDNLFSASQGAGKVRGPWKDAMPTSLYTRILEQNPSAKRVALGVFAGLLLGLARRAGR